jgi:hypothetical protein
MSTDEVIYEFKRGQGWVCIPRVAYRDVRNYDGSKLRVWARPPRTGEFFRSRRRRTNPDYFHPDGSPNLDAFARSVECCYDDDISKRDDESGNDIFTYGYVTIELLDE